MEMLEMGEPGMQPRSWDRILPAGIELWGLAGSGDTQNSLLPAKKGAANSQVCVPVFFQIAWPWSPAAGACWKGFCTWQELLMVEKRLNLPPSGVCNRVSTGAVIEGLDL